MQLNSSKHKLSLLHLNINKYFKGSITTLLQIGKILVQAHNNTRTFILRHVFFCSESSLKYSSVIKA